MSIDLQDLFNEEGLGAPPAKLDTDYVIRRGRRVRARRRVVVTTSTLVGVAAVGSVALMANSSFVNPVLAGGGVAPGSGGSASLSPAGTSSPQPGGTPSASPSGNGSTASPTPEPTTSGTPSPSSTPVSDGPPPADLSAVGLANPAPGFPVLLSHQVSQWSPVPEQPTRWVAEFALGVSPKPRPTPTPGQTTGQPAKSEVTIYVGAYSSPVHLDGFESRAVAGSPAVAGVTGRLAEYTYRDTAFSVLYFSTGKFTVEIIGNDVTTAELVALGDALTGLQ